MPTRKVAPWSRGIRVDRRCGHRIDERVVLLSAGWGEASVADQPFHLLRRSTMGRVGRRHYVFLDHERAEIVAAEPQRDLPDFHAHRYPARLEVRNVVEN